MVSGGAVVPAAAPHHYPRRLRIPTKHRQQMIEAGYAKPHHGHHPDAVAQQAALDQEQRDKLDAAAEATAVAQANADKEIAAKRAEQDARHEAELDAMYPRRRKG